MLGEKPTTFGYAFYVETKTEKIYHSIFAHHLPIVIMVKALRYYPLPTKTSIRLLNVRPSKHLDDQIVCQFRIAGLRDNPKYRALSYTGERRIRRSKSFAITK